MKDIKIFVEKEIEKIILINILTAANYPLKRIEIAPTNGKNVLLAAKKYHYDDSCRVAVFLKVNARHLINQKEEAENTVKDTNILPFFAIPSIEAWAFADDLLIEKHIKVEYAKEILHIPLPEDIMYPTSLFRRWIKKGKEKVNPSDYAFLQGMNISRAVLRCPTLRYFLTELALLLELPPLNQWNETLVYSFSLQLIAGILKSYTPEDTVLFHSLKEGELNAGRMRKELQEGTELGRDYCRAILETSIRIIQKESQRKAVQ
ncbi:MAG: hypothetical protein ACKVTZ_22790 [Bacteroidia bacterium]